MMMEEGIREQLKRYVGAIEELEEEKSAIATHIRELYQEAKKDGLNVKALRQVIRMRRMDKETIEHHQSTLHTYLSALGLAE